MASDVNLAGMDPELEAFIALFPQGDLSDPVTARKNLAALAARAPVPDTTGMEIENRMVPANPNVPVRIYRPYRAQGAIVWLHGGGFVMGDLETGHPWAVRIADGSQALVGVGGLPPGPRAAVPSRPGRCLRRTDLDGRTRRRTGHRPGEDCGQALNDDIGQPFKIRGQREGGGRCDIGAGLLTNPAAPRRRRGRGGGAPLRSPSFPGPRQEYQASIMFTSQGALEGNSPVPGQRHPRDPPAIRPEDFRSVDLAPLRSTNRHGHVPCPTEAER
jgi:hypothetical protein